VQEVGWAPGPVWTDAENLSSHRDSILLFNLVDAVAPVHAPAALLPEKIWYVRRVGSLDAVRKRKYLAIAPVRFRKPVPQSCNPFPPKHTDQDITAPQVFRMEL
jgi:hypothetical protein